jgi:mannitol/fructose-specific phosphotransferase system IIA component (Ntr-type)/Kef-type K+ transport system membrane component KefB
MLALAVVLVAGVASGMLVRRFHLPAVTGQILVGILLGPVLHVFDHATLGGLAPMTDFALGLMAVAVGSHLHLRRLHNAKTRLFLLVALESTLTPVLVFVVVMLVPDTTWTLALLLSALAVSTAPATILALVKETRSKGVFVKTLVAAVALNNIAAIALFELAHAVTADAIDPTIAQTPLVIVGHTLRTFALSIGLGTVVGLVLIAVTRNIVRSDRLASLSLIAILLTAGVASQFDVFSTLLACMTLGVILANLTPDKEEIGHKVFENFEHAIFAVFFTLAGMELDFEYVVPGGLLALFVFGARFVGKQVSATTAMRAANATQGLRRYLGMALTPQAGLAVGLMLLVTEDPTFLSIRSLFLAVVLTLVTLNEIVGPVLTRLALLKSGDYGKDRARLIDFLHEENITTELEAETLEDAIEQLVDLLVRSNALSVDRDVLLASVLERERQASTLLGDGLAIPHGDIEEGDRIVGVMGISRPGLPFDAPDGLPIHCLIVLATPPSARLHHLEVLAAFARTIGADRTVRQQLFHAHSPAHAYEILHAEEHAEDFNTYLDEE